MTGPDTGGRPAELGREPIEAPTEAPTEPGVAGAPEADLAERRRRADRATRGALAGLLSLEAFVVLLVPRAIAQTSQGLSTTTTVLLIALAVVLVVSAFVLRRPWGIGLGSALQVLLAATVLLIPVLAVVIVLFLLLWWYVLRTRRQLVATPSGWRMLIS
ncbi:MAG: DUF4233 domain-containing protein [Actinobacteria bacterium]|nr:DUF4233 domain-containing protein [Actinomycetota bacterium]